jgi:hypothetical protein
MNCIRKSCCHTLRVVVVGEGGEQAGQVPRLLL